MGHQKVLGIFEDPGQEASARRLTLVYWVKGMKNSVISTLPTKTLLLEKGLDCVVPMTIYQKLKQLSTLQ